MQQPFIGRQEDLSLLAELYRAKSSHIAVIKGRRRVGKSRLVDEFATAHAECYFAFTALAPAEGDKAQRQRDHFSYQLARLLNLPPVSFHDWADAFHYLSQHLKAGTIIFFDEISWMAAHDPTFVPKLKVWWDITLSKKEKLLLIICGSVSTWIEENIVNSTALYGRISLVHTLEPLSLSDSARLLRARGFHGSHYDVIKLLSVFGGIPWYLEQVDSQFMADNNIKKLCFSKSGLLVNEFDRIFHDLFSHKGTLYKKILYALNDGMKTQVEIRKLINMAPSGTLSQMLEHLVIAGFIAKHYQWSFKTGKISKSSLYRISDPYIRFYLKYIEPNRQVIEAGGYKVAEMSQLPGFDADIGFQVEALLLQDRELLQAAIGIRPGDCIAEGPYRQVKTTRHEGCQVDYLVQAKPFTLYFCEFKFNIRELGPWIIKEVTDKIRRVVVPRHYAAVPILFHIGGVSRSVRESHAFYRIVDIVDLIEPCGDRVKQSPCG